MPKPRRSFISVGLRSAAAHLALPLSSLLTGPLIARALEPSGRGAMAALLGPISLVNLAVTLGAPDAMTYFVARGDLTRRQARRFVLAATSICGVVSVAVLVAATPYLLRKYDSLQDEFILMSLTLPLTLGFASVRGAVLGMHKFDQINLERVLGASVRLVAIVAAIQFGLLTASSASWITILSGLAASFVLLAGFLRWPYPEVSAAGAAEVSRYAGGSALASAGTVLVLHLDQVLMVPIAPAEQLGYYAVAVSLAVLPLVVVTAVRDIVFAVASGSSDPGVTPRVMRASMPVVLLACGLGCLVAPFALPLLFGRPFEPAVEMTQILLVATIPAAVTAILGAGLQSLGRTAVWSTIQVAGVVLTCVLLLALVPSFGGVGAAIASLLTYAALALATAVAYSRASGETLRGCLVPGRADFGVLWLSLRPGKRR